MERKIALFGGTFDPIHKGHTIVAEYASEYVGAETVVLIPAHRSPHKQAPPQASAADRIEMIRLITKEKKAFRLSECELSRPEPSYTLETVNELKAHYGREVQMYWLVGADSVNDLPSWYRINELIDECNLCVMLRAGFDRPDFNKFQDILGPKRVEKLQQNTIPTPLIDINSTEIRNRIAAGQNVSDMLHPAVLQYICQRNLYRR
jgi:nicotinate-nucleotide adenylyltransferase